MFFKFFKNINQGGLRRISKKRFSMSAREKLRAKNLSRFVSLQENEDHLSSQGSIRNIGTIAHIGTSS